jgi:hypothetical protein
MLNQMIGYVQIAIVISFIIGMFFGYQYHRHLVKKEKEEEDGSS